MKRLLLLTPLLTTLALPASAQTILSLTASGSATAAPDEAVAQLEIQATKPKAADAQAEVNQAVAKALSAARALKSLTVTTGSYNTYTVTADRQTAPEFTAEQSLMLVQPAAGGVPDAAFGELLAKLQSEGLLLTGLTGDLSIAGQQKRQAEAVQNALANLRTEAASIASTLHKKVGALQSLTVDTAGGYAPPMGARVMALAAASPQSAPSDLSTTARITAKIELDPAQ